jgi:hypothetical protein
VRLSHTCIIYRLWPTAERLYSAPVATRAVTSLAWKCPASALVELWAKEWPASTVYGTFDLVGRSVLKLRIWSGRGRVQEPIPVLIGFCFACRRLRGLFYDPLRMDGRLVRQIGQWLSYELATKAVFSSRSRYPNVRSRLEVLS